MLYPAEARYDGYGSGVVAGYVPVVTIFLVSVICLNITFIHHKDSKRSERTIK